ncbi:YciI family protein [Rubinisphaera sp.]|uniref:YciI family protein n=1 Tax=Rubinisphaera sp. TaxID=2024857 RepID=UPI000C10C135|nr:YciI family protein [Rubinisphaera sp.]MBV08011.1 hypothetical protein [Rubinisphaera sp.]HCS53477.1 hypothetical protein [Planctomycetaceae bacterium]|tara:strand:- start:2002 stop:2385 length:384 start_codon:yes stop_codon:yes gene_type:complete
MKFLLLIHSAEDAWPPDEHAVALEESVQLCHQLHAKHEYLGAAPLQPAETATCVKVRNGQPIVSDGPYVETKEQLGGYFLIDVKDREAAIAIAAQIPGSRRGTTEIRPVVEVTNLPHMIPYNIQDQQ